MSNCLKTQLKEAVDNSNFVELGHVRLVKKSEAGVGSLVVRPARYKPNILIESVNNESVNIEAYYGQSESDFSALCNAEKGTIIDISNKYVLGSIIMEYGAYEISTEVFKYSPMTYYSVAGNGANFYGDIANLVYSTNILSGFNIMNNNISGNISCLIGKLTEFSQNAGMNLSKNPDLEGSLSSDFLPFTGKTINISGTKITTTQAVIDDFSANNVTVTYDESQIEE